MKNLPDPSRALHKITYETFCQARAAGRDLASSWGEALQKQNNSSTNGALKVSAVRISQRPEVQNRIAYLIQQRRLEAAVNEDEEIEESFDRAAIVRLTLEITRALEEALERALKSSISDTKVQQLKNTLSSHLSRQSKMSETHFAEIEQIITAQNLNFGFIKDCKCQTTH